jgi:ribosome-associated toxin RatA of RatAB toxin-antitoxin module
MPHVQREARVPYTAAQMFALVNDVESYPEFLPWCRAARIERRDGEALEAVLEIGLRGIHKSFRTRNTLERPRRIRIELVSGPFTHLNGVWSFEDLDEGGSRVGVSLDFEVKRSPFAALFASVFEELVRSQMAAFIRRAHACYG